LLVSAIRSLDILSVKKEPKLEQVRCCDHWPHHTPDDK